MLKKHLIVMAPGGDTVHPHLLVVPEEGMAWIEHWSYRGMGEWALRNESVKEPRRTLVTWLANGGAVVNGDDYRPNPTNTYNSSQPRRREVAA